MSDRSGPKCPICGRPAVREARPFCSRRCADADLVRWVGGAYRIPVADDEADRASDPGEAGVHGLIPRAP